MYASVAASATNIKITNSGTIEVRSEWHLAVNAAGAAPVIVNSGIIKGGMNAILAENGDRFNVTNSGQIIGNVRGTSANQSDTVVNSGTVSAAVFLGTGADTYSGFGTVAGGVFGEAGNDTLSGGNGSDRLVGGPETTPSRESAA